MLAPTHILAGVIFTKLFNWRQYLPVAFFLTATLGIFSHALLDKLAVVTYCPAYPDFANLFWLAYHLLMVLISIIFLYLWWGEAKWGILFALLPDIDWLFIYPRQWLHLSGPFYDQPYIHQALDWMMNHTIPFCYLNSLPDNRSEPLAALWEFAGMLLLLLLIYRLDKRRRNIYF